MQAATISVKAQCTGGRQHQVDCLQLLDYAARQPSVFRASHPSSHQSTCASPFCIGFIGMLHVSANLQLTGAQACRAAHGGQETVQGFLKGSQCTLPASYTLDRPETISV